MDPKNIERYSRWARPVLEAGVRARMLLLGIAAAGDTSRVEAGAASAGGAVLPAEEARMRDALLAELDERGEEELVRRAAYTWFNRLLALRYLELKGLLPHGRHVLSDASGTGLPPEAASEPEALGLPALPCEAALRLKAAGDVQATFRAVLVAQAGALARALPKAFGPEGDPLALLLPDGLLGPEGAVRRLVEDLPTDDLEKPEALGWAYQYWVAEEKDSVFAAFKKGKKAGERELPVATQLFTPDWIVDYLVENSLGRLWMLNAPDSPLANAMPYYIAPEGETEPTLDISSPEEITFCDPACGSGHMMLAAFRLLGAMYEEVGYRRRDVPALVLANNLSGMEIDPRAAQLAELCLALEACSWDRNFLEHPTRVDVTVLQSVSIDPSELPRGCALARDKELLDALSHLSLAGSLLEPSAKDVSDLKGALASLPGGLGDADLRNRLERALSSCEALSRHFAVVVTNPPYMGSKNMAPWLKAFAEKHYPDAKRDLCTCFIERCGVMSVQKGYCALVTMESWMFISSFESFRKKILKDRTIRVLVYMNHMVMRIAFNTCATIFQNLPNGLGLFTRVNYQDLNESGCPSEFPVKDQPVYRRSAGDFKDIPGTPIAYWASDAVRRAFKEGKPLKSYVEMPYGFKTGDNNTFLRRWWECNVSEIDLKCNSYDDAIASYATWFPYNKGGSFRKWYGNREYLLNYKYGGKAVMDEAKIAGRSAADYDHKLLFRPTVTWTRISSGSLHTRFTGYGAICDMTGPGMYGRDSVLKYLQAFCNSSTALEMASILSPTLDFQPGQIGNYPIADFPNNNDSICEIVDQLRRLSEEDWNSFEPSWDFQRSPLV